MTPYLAVAAVLLVLAVDVVFLRPLIGRWTCTGITATWCPIHGDCSCPPHEYGLHYGRTLDDPACRLHAPNSDHSEDR